ncbi:hypothetical protein GMOD_00006088 [Pyrenophora seminiperda CCB06]|uniref:Uncharacterized protein n=1 Tax=Pyrenophora seminiperda CCB06 TaxID=1302712 RepID=A0A3M7M4D0_9PLEO|nr:hypothetical protein GMOD_00006088 [Pyrenophora seminiperda CCB06]
MIMRNVRLCEVVKYLKLVQCTNLSLCLRCSLARIGNNIYTVCCNINMCSQLQIIHSHISSSLTVTSCITPNTRKTSAFIILFEAFSPVVNLLEPF